MGDVNRWLSAADGAALLRFTAELSPCAAAIIERRCIAPWQRRRRNLAQRDAAILALAGDYLEASGRKMAQAIVRDLRRPGSAPASRRALIERVLAHGRPPGAESVRRILAGLGKNHVMPFPAGDDRTDHPEVKDAPVHGFDDGIAAKAAGR